MEVTHSISRNMQGELYLIANRDNGASMPFSPNETRRVYEHLEALYAQERTSWKCPQCGEIEGTHVSYEETCCICGSNVI